MLCKWFSLFCLNIDYSIGNLNENLIKIFWWFVGWWESNGWCASAGAPDLFGYVEFPIAAFLLTTNLKLFYMLHWIIFPSSLFWSKIIKRINCDHYRMTFSSGIWEYMSFCPMRKHELMCSSLERGHPSGWRSLNSSFGWLQKGWTYKFIVNSGR